jgi:hypothetical protein
MSKHMFNAILIFVAFLVTCAAIASGSYFNAGLIMEVDSVSEIRVRAPRDTEDFAETQRNRDAALVLAEGLDEVFTVNTGLWVSVENNLKERRAELEYIRAAYVAELEEYNEAVAEWEELFAAHEQLVERLLSEFQAELNAAREMGEMLPVQPTLPPEPEFPEWEGAAFELFVGFTPIVFGEAQQAFIIDMTEENFEQMWAAVDAAANFVQNNEVMHYRDVMMERAVHEALRGYALDRTTDALAEHIVLFTLRPNAVPNVELNQQRYDDAANNFVIAMIYEGDIIVDEGEIVTQEIYNILSRLDMLAPESLADNLYPMLGVFFIVAVLFLSCLMYLKFFRKGIGANLRESMLLFTLYLLTVALVWTRFCLF